MTLGQAKVIATLLYLLAFVLFAIGGWLVFAGIGAESTRAALIGFVAVVIGVVFFRFATSLLKDFRKG
ncbi:MAG: hypothetical protein D6726_08230 [Nitrospirae bacterium]|nr:MAG: hypothetical protein D6726_08230 [Nitrospirota bacterium]